MLPQGMNMQEQEGKAFDPLPEDVYQVQLFDIEAQEKPSYDDKSKMETILSFQFIVLDDGKFRGRSVWKNFVRPYLYIGKNGKNDLFQITEAMIMRELTEEERHSLTGDFVNKLIGYQCRITIKNKQSKDGTKAYSNIETFLPKKSSLPSLTDEEKEKATPKKKVEEVKSALGKNYQELPTINLDEEMTMNQGDNQTATPEPDEEVEIADVPFK